MTWSHQWVIFIFLFPVLPSVDQWKCYTPRKFHKQVCLALKWTFLEGNWGEDLTTFVPHCLCKSSGHWFSLSFWETLNLMLHQWQISISSMFSLSCLESSANQNFLVSHSLLQARVNLEFFKSWNVYSLGNTFNEKKVAQSWGNSCKQIENTHSCPGRGRSK